MTEAAPKSQDIIVDEVFPHAARTIWTALTTGDLIARWLNMMPTGFAPVAGTPFTFRTTPAGAWDGVIHCRVLEVIPNERLVYSWRGGHDSNVGYGSRLDTTVTYTLSSAAGGTRLRVVHSGFVLPQNDTAFRNMSDGWVRCVQRIDTIATEQK